MRMYDLIMKKRDGGVLTKEEIDYFIEGYTKGLIPDYQASALLMAIYFKKMSYDETLNLTLAMSESGDKLDLSGISGIKADKHSTGGVGDKTSLVLAPMIAACGVKMAKMSGRGLGHTGGTIDKLESFPGFSTALSEEAFISNVNNIGFAITGQTGNLAPADKKLYALRDVTATVDNISLIASSIMSKKLAAGAELIVLDVKSGSGAFMKNEKDALLLAEEMVKIGNGAGRNTIAVVSDMNQPLGHAVGNAIEVKEAIMTLKGEGPDDLYNLCICLGVNILMAAKRAATAEEAQNMLEDAVKSGAALKKFAEFVEAQGSKQKYVYNYENSLPKCSEEVEVKSSEQGFVSLIKSDEIGKASMILGGGRQTKDDKIDLSVGLEVYKKIGDYVNKGDVIAKIFSNNPKKTQEAERIITAAYEFSENKVLPHKLIKRVITAKDCERLINI
ncbi:MAG: pyrimidine-nucleoside phosphorylase [Lachnospira sp.]